MPRLPLRRIAPTLACLPLAISTMSLFSCASSTPIYEDHNRAFEKTLLAQAQDAIARKVFPGCSLLVLDDDAIKAEIVAGAETYAKDAPAITAQHRFDLASLTKVVATTSLTMALIDRGKISLEDKVSRFFPEFSGGGKQHVTIRFLLAHCSGLPPYLQFWKNPKVKDFGSGLEEVLKAPLVYEPGKKWKYSDLGMIILAACLEKAGGAPFAKLCQTLVFDPLDMEETGFAPLPEGSVAVPTEVVGKELIQGVVHDENARAFGGVCGHAGLFSTARDLAKLARCLIDGGRYGQKQVFRNSTVARFTSRALIVPGSDRALGWGTPSGDSSSGSFFSERSVGHTGFTGTSIWIEMEQRLAIIILSNRVHPKRSPANRKGIHEFRKSVADLVIRQLRRQKLRHPRQKSFQSR
ncbi:MAG: hypothetical protein CSA62_09965 [Planctomycetota bacterium]|nr:MAG: hypothetical protein CSA62_09965 [Planctomycetota bacterium]